jgi:ABC-2 type transport system permease protein
MLHFYVEVARTAFRRQLIYRWANLAGLLTNAFFGSVFSYVIIALYRARPVVAGYNLNDTLRYTWLVQAMIMVVLPFGWWELMQTIRSGEVVADMSKPCDFYWYWFSREVGRDIYYLLFRCIPTYIIGMLLFGIGLTTEWRSWVAYCLAFALGAMIGIAYRFLYNVIAFWIIEARAVATLAAVIALFFTGSYVPLPFFPAGLRTFASWLPFNGLMNLPAELLGGKLTGESVAFELGRQLFWLIVITVLVRSITVRAGRRIISQGG